MANQFGGSAPATSFLVGLASSTMDAFKQDHERELAEDYQAKTIDHDLLMKALKQVQDDDTLTPSQRSAATQEIMQRSVDIFKPKGHGGIKDNLKNLFGGGERYQPQGVGDILTKQRPKLDVHSIVPGGTESVDFMGGADKGGVTLPAPPSLPYVQRGGEKTYHEMARDEKMQDIDAVTDRQLAVEEARSLHRKQLRDTQNEEIRKRFREQYQIKDDALVTRKLRERAAIYNPLDPDDPVAQQRASQSMQDEIISKKAESAQRLELGKARIRAINENIARAKERIEVARQGLGVRARNAWKDDAQVKGAWQKVNDYSNEAQRLYAMMAAAHGKYIESGYLDDAAEAESNAYLEAAQKAEREMQNVIGGIDSYVQQKKDAGVSLPNFQGGAQSGENPKIRAYANKYFKGDYAAAEAYAKAHP